MRHHPRLRVRPPDARSGIYRASCRGGWARGASVSYTHLDVYKRQGKQRRIAKNPLHVVPQGVQQDADGAGTGHFPFHTLEKAEADTEPGQLIRLGARTATTAIGLARARGTARLESRVCDMICPASYGSHRRSGNAGKSPRLKRKGVGSERKGTPDEAGMSKADPPA